MDTTGLRSTHDAWGRLVKVEYVDPAGTLHPRAEYEYNGLNWRTIKRSDTDLTDGVQQLDEQRQMYYNDKWQLLEERIDADYQSGPGVDRHIQYVWGPPEVRYIDEIVARRVDTNPAAQDGYEDIYFHLTDAQFSTVAVLDETAEVLERVSYTAYGQARQHPRGDLTGDVTGDATPDVHDGTVNVYDQLYLLGVLDADPDDEAFIDEPAYDAAADLTRDGVVNIQDTLDLLGNWGGGVPDGLLSDPAIDNTIGYGGYVFNPEVELYHVRFRWYSPELGRWLERDPAGYMDGMNLYGMSGHNPIGFVDALGLARYDVDHPVGWEQFGADMAAKLRRFDLKVKRALHDIAQTLPIWKMGGAFELLQLVPEGHVREALERYLLQVYGLYKTYFSLEKKALAPRWDGWVRTPIRCGDTFTEEVGLKGSVGVDFMFNVSLALEPFGVGGSFSDFFGYKISLQEEGCVFVEPQKYKVDSEACRITMDLICNARVVIEFSGIVGAEWRSGLIEDNVGSFHSDDLFGDCCCDADE